MSNDFFSMCEKRRKSVDIEFIFGEKKKKITFPSCGMLLLLLIIISKLLETNESLKKTSGSIII